MNRSVEQALTSLIPRHNGALPPELIELASSLLAQSRNKASNLKAEEEIGRTYACANIACERLKQSLNLPKIEPRPPCPPRIYNKLYTYLDSILVVRRSSRPTQRPRSADSPPPPKSLPSRPTPSRSAALAPFQATTTTTSPATARTPRARKRGLRFADSTREIAPWIHPVIRRLCRELQAPAAAPHVLAGVTTILTLPSPVSSLSAERGGGGGGGGDDDDRKVDDKKDKIPALIAAVFLFVGTRLTGRQLSGPEYVARRKAVLGVLMRLRGDKELVEKIRGMVAAGQDGVGWEGWESVGTKDVNAWLMEIPARDWLKLDWFENITQGAGVELSDHHRSSHVDKEEGGEQEGNDDDNDDDDGSHPEIYGEDGLNDRDVILQSGFGTMMQARLDYLSDRKRAQYKIWKRGILAQMERMERGEGGGGDEDEEGEEDGEEEEEEE